MNFDKANAALDSVYSAETPEALAKAYAEWAATYDSETASLGYLLPFLIAAWVARHVPTGDGPLLDAGCGTGLSGPSLKALGYGDIAGLDLSDDMLKLAGSRQAYSELKKAMLGGPLPWPDRHFRAFFSTGVFTIGHAPASGLHELVRVTKSGGHAIFTVRD
ncbi:MAG: class I SAM-dependent methyltransferase, partial [Mesorhizobium sp.]